MVINSNISLNSSFLINELKKITLLCCTVLLIYYVWYTYNDSSIIQSIIFMFYYLTGVVVNLLSADIVYENSTLFIENSSISKTLIFSELIIPTIICLISVLFVYVRKFILNILVLFGIVFFLIVRAALITILFFSEASKEYQVLLNILDTIRYIPFYLIALYIVFNNQFFKIYYLRIKEKFNEVLQFDINIVIILLIMNSLPRILITFTYPEILDYVTIVILNISHFTLNLFGVETYINYKTIYIAENWIYLGHGCLGLGLMTMVIVLIAATKSPVINKLTFIIILLPVQIIFNSFRIDLLVIYYYNNWDLTIQSMDMHDYSNVFIYSLGFAMFLLYYFWYQEVKVKIGCKKQISYTNA